MGRAGGEMPPPVPPPPPGTPCTEPRPIPVEWRRARVDIKLNERGEEEGASGGVEPGMGDGMLPAAPVDACGDTSAVLLALLLLSMIIFPFGDAAACGFGALLLAVCCALFGGGMGGRLAECECECDCALASAACDAAAKSTVGVVAVVAFGVAVVFVFAIGMAVGSAMTCLVNAFSEGRTI